MDPTSQDRVRALERGLQIVELLSRRGLSSLADLRRETGLGNAALYRLLGTLQARGWVRRNIVEGQYELAHSLGTLLGEAARAHPLAELAAPILLDLKGRMAGLPSEIATIRAPGKIEIIESTRLRGPMAPLRTGLGLRPSMVMSAHGRVILAFVDPAERAAHLAAITGSATKRERGLIDTGGLEREIATARARGYGLREPAFWMPPFDNSPEMGAMAVPILSRSGVHGSLSLLWIAEDMSLEEVLSKGSYDDLRKGADKIGQTLDRHGIAAPRVAVQAA